jgi:hypothetical protein
MWRWPSPIPLQRKGSGSGNAEIYRVSLQGVVHPLIEARTAVIMIRTQMAKPTARDTAGVGAHSNMLFNTRQLAHLCF